MGIEDLTADVAFDAFARPLTVTPPGGDAISTRGIVTPNSEVQREGTYAVDLATIIALPKADTGLPKRETEITGAAGTWFVDEVASDDGHIVEAVVRDAD